MSHVTMIRHLDVEISKVELTETINAATENASYLIALRHEIVQFG